MKKYTKNIQENILFRSIHTHNNRAIENGQIGKLTIEQANIALQYFNNRCAFSGEQFIKSTRTEEKQKMRSLSLEHIIALTKGGNSLAYNCVPSIWHYNLRKSTHHPLDWWKKQKNIKNEPIFHPIRLLKLVNYMMKSLKGLEEKEIEKYQKIVMPPNKVDNYINQNTEKLYSAIKTIEIQQVPYNLKIHRLRNSKKSVQSIKLDLFILDCINLLKEYNIPPEIIKYLKKEFRELKEVKKIFEKIPEEEKIQKQLINKLKQKKIENIYTVASAVNIEEIRKRKIKIEDYLEEKLEKIQKALEKNKIDKNKINILLDIAPKIIEDKEEQEIIIKMLDNFRKSKSENLQEYLSKLENRVEAEDAIFIKDVLRKTKKDIQYLNKEEMRKLEKKLLYNREDNRKEGRRLIRGYEKLYQELKEKEIDEPKLSQEASKAYIYCKVGPDGFTSLQENDKYTKEIMKKVFKNYKKGILALDFYLLENKQDKSIEEADEELTKEILERIKPFLNHLDEKEQKILEKKLKSNSKTCRSHGTRLINAYNRIYYAMKKQGMNEPELGIETSKAYVYSKVCQVGFYSLQCNESKYKDRSIEKIMKHYQQEFVDIEYYLLDNKVNISKQQANQELTDFILENTKEITSSLNQKEKEMLKKQLAGNYVENGTNRLIVAYHKIYYELKKQGMQEPKLTKEASKAYVYAKIAQVGFIYILQRERNKIKENIKKVLEEYEEGLKKLDFYLINSRSEKQIENLDEKLTQKILKNTKEIVEKLDLEQQEKLKNKLIQNAKGRNNKGIRLINAYNRIYYEIKKKGIYEPKLTKETCKAYLYAKISEFGFASLMVENKKYTHRNLKILLNSYQEKVKHMGYYLMDRKYDKSVEEADEELTKMVFENIKEITDKLDEKERKKLKEELRVKSKSNSKKGARLIYAYNEIYYAMKQQGMEEPMLTRRSM